MRDSVKSFTRLDRFDFYNVLVARIPVLSAVAKSRIIIKICDEYDVSASRPDEETIKIINNNCSTHTYLTRMQFRMMKLAYIFFRFMPYNSCISK